MGELKKSGRKIQVFEGEGNRNEMGRGGSEKDDD